MTTRVPGCDASPSTRRARGAAAAGPKPGPTRSTRSANELPESGDGFWSAVRSLPDRQAQIVALHYLDDRPVDEIAELLEIAPGTVKTQLHRARATLANRLRVDLEDAP